MTTSDPDVSDLVAAHLRDVPDFPKPGVVFKDITPLLGDGPAFGEVIRALAARYADGSRRHTTAGEGRTADGSGRHTTAGEGRTAAGSGRHTGSPVPQRIDAVAGIEARGFIIGGALAHELGVGFVPVRKVGKLPGATVQRTYDLEYGTATIEIHTDAVTPGQRVLLVDDVLATGGTAIAAWDLLEGAGAEVVAFETVVELAFLGGRAALGERSVRALHVVEGTADN
ncbi:adenine phosphoribosyltransferase [Knoellia remsis]|uniref:Adenine phosphoribosyltransferase n=1 Tax=Knoellia remsis TaxID=407159 RepID=A0A2T0UFC8_9MICO|nr:adenine phosphoribosyltransferase [Knoellia remsis]PRY56645.1 adenine phosphoribosyltransferase [Knoellia remsis]